MVESKFEERKHLLNIIMGWEKKKLLFQWGIKLWFSSLTNLVKIIKQ